MRANLFLAVLIFLGLLSLSQSLRGNIFASDIRFDVSTNNAVIGAGHPALISFILNEPATGGTTAKVLSGTNLVRMFSMPPGAAGTLAGSNGFVWDGTDQKGSNTAPGFYTVQISAVATGYSTWTNLSDDGPSFSVPQPNGIAVNRNTNSLFYGRVFVSSSPGAGAPLGICKFNADGSPADEGSFSTGGYQWQSGSDLFYSPWKIAISSDDTVYIDDWSGNGVVLAFDGLLTTNNFYYVLTTNNYPYPGPFLSGPFVQGSGTNKQIWMADINNDGAGILRWNIGADGIVATNDTGTTIVSNSPGSDLNYAPYAVALDTNGNIYTIQHVDGTDNPAYLSTQRVLRFPPYSGRPETNAVWKMGAFSNSLDYCYGVAVDPTGTFLAVASIGSGGLVFNNGGVTILYASNGVVITNINQAVGGVTNLECRDVTWDNVGNLYATDGYHDVWRVYSPPGTNQSTAHAIPIIEVYQTLARPVLTAATAVTDTNGICQLQFTLQGQSNVTYLIEQSDDLINWNAIATNYDTSPVRSLSVAPADQQDFYRARVAPAF
jgi:hypothetical protein